MPLKTTPEPKPRTFPVRPILSVAVLLFAIAALVLALKTPRPIAAVQAPAVKAANAESFQNKINQLAQSDSGTEVHFTGEEVSAAFTEPSAAQPTTQPATDPPTPSTTSSVDPSASISPGDAANAIVGEPVVSFEGDQVQGQFVSEISGKKVYVTVKGHLGASDGYVTFDPTEFKVGDLNVPVGLVSDALKKKMAEQKDRLKLPDNISDVRVENGELVVTKKDGATNSSSE